jgi:BMFP domain-containing protein YqiC
MKVRVRFTVDVDPARWAEEYRVARSEVRRDVQQHVESYAVAQLDSMDLLADPTSS